MNNNFCQFCGNKLNGTENTCPNCGGPISQPPQMGQIQPNFVQQQPIPNQPNYGQQIPNTTVNATKNMPMTYHYIFTGIMTLVTISGLISGPDIIVSGLLIATVIGLFMKKAFGRVLAMICSALYIITGIGVAVSPFTPSGTKIIETLELTEYSSEVIVTTGIIVAVWGILTVFYYNKRSTMFK